ncbi:MAG TPA: nuclear transport factor 2 family protein [Polyangiaceae bacterium]|nr:nuclear transport factor 2 family protein [Polyangiaceae bacterium]
MEDAMAVIERLTRATNDHDVDALAACFAEDYVLESPAHPQRSFRGREQVRRNWTQIFAGVPDVRARIVGSARDGDTVWTEWEHSGTRRDGSKHVMCGVFVFGVKDGLIRTGRMFFEPVEAGGADVNAAVGSQVGTKD